MISTIDLYGRVNLAPYSFFNALADTPPIVAFSSFGRKHTVQNAEKTGEFVANLATYALAEQMNITSMSVEADIDEMNLAGLTAAPSTLVRAPRVAESPAALECKVTGITELRDVQGRPVNYFLVTGEVVGVHIHVDALRNGLFDTARARNLARCGYRSQYCDAGEMFELVRPDDQRVEEHRRPSPSGISSG